MTPITSFFFDAYEEIRIRELNILEYKNTVTFDEDKFLDAICNATNITEKLEVFIKILHDENFSIDLW